MTTYSDEYIEHWGGIYLATPAIRARGVLFRTFLLYPHEILDVITHCDAEPLPLLPPQQAVMRGLAEAEHDALIPVTAQRRGQSFIERLRHHCWLPRKHRRVSV